MKKSIISVVGVREPVEISWPCTKYVLKAFFKSPFVLREVSRERGGDRQSTSTQHVSADGYGDLQKLSRVTVSKNVRNVRSSLVGGSHWTGGYAVAAWAVLFHIEGVSIKK